MFRIDDNEVIDATMCGGPARYVNHSCNPNCMAEVVSIGEENKIIIIAKRRISRGEEVSVVDNFLRVFLQQRHGVHSHSVASNIKTFSLQIRCIVVWNILENCWNMKYIWVSCIYVMSKENLISILPLLLR